MQCTFISEESKREGGVSFIRLTMQVTGAFKRRPES